MTYESDTQTSNLASCKSALNPPVVCSTDRSKAVVPVLVLLFVALWFILRGDLLYVFPCVILFLCFSAHLVLRLPRLGKRELILVLFVRLFGLCLFRFVGFLFLLGSGKGFGLWLWHSLDFSLTFFTKPKITKCQKYKWRYLEKAIITKHSPSEATSHSWGTQWQTKGYIRNHRRPKKNSNRENYNGTLNRKTTKGLNQFYSRKTSPLFLLQIWITNIYIWST